MLKRYTYKIVGIKGSMKNKSMRWNRRRINLLLPILLIIIFCSKQTESMKFIFNKELTIGTDTETEGAWFSSLNDFCVDAAGRIYCADGADRKIKGFKSNGAPAFSFGQKGQGPGEFAYPNGIAVSKNGNIFVADAGRRNLTKFDSAGNYLHSIQFGSPVAKIGAFECGNVVVEIARFALGEDIKESVFELAIYDSNLNEVKTGIFERSVDHYAWIDVNEQHMTTQVIPFAPKIIWHILGNRLYVGYTDEFKISVLDESGNIVDSLSKNVVRENVPGEEKEKWIEQRLQDFEGRPGIIPNIMRESMEKVKLPALKPAFTGMSDMGSGLIVFGNQTESGFPATLYDINNFEIGQAYFGFDDFKYFGGKYYRRVTADEEPAVLVRYFHSENKK